MPSDDEEEYTNLSFFSVVPALAIHILLTFHLPSPCPSLSHYTLIILISGMPTQSEADIIAAAHYLADLCNVRCVTPVPSHG